MEIVTERFGKISYEEDELLNFPQGLVGFPGKHKYILLKQPEIEPFIWLQSVEDPGLCFLTIDPFIFFPDFELEVELDDDLLSQIGTITDLGVIVIVTIGEDFKDSTANLLGPIVYNRSTMLAWQLILDNSNYSTKHKLFTNVNQQAAAGK